MPRGYRGIVPIPTVNCSSHLLNQPQFVWRDSINTGDVQTALFAGQIMTISLNDDGSWQLTYLDWAHPESFKTKESAQVAASDFARAVLLLMLNHVGVRKEDDSLLKCLLMNGE